MSNSIKKTPKRGITCCESEKQDKKIANKKFRRIVKDKIKKQNEVMPLIREVSDVWAFVDISAILTPFSVMLTP